MTLDGLFGITPEQINESNKAHAINYVAILIVLTDKGIISADEFVFAKVRATSIVDQEFAEKRENAEREFDEEHPGARDLLKAITGFDYNEKPIGS